MLEEFKPFGPLFCKGSVTGDSHTSKCSNYCPSDTQKYVIDYILNHGGIYPYPVISMTSVKQLLMDMKNLPHPQ